MQNQDTFKQSRFSSIVVSIAMIFDGLTMGFGGLVYLFAAGSVDFPDLETKRALLLQGEIIAVLTFVYMIACFIFLSYWLGGGHVWSYVILGLGIIHFAAASYLLTVTDTEIYADVIYPLPYSSIVVNLILVIIVYNKYKLGLSAKSSNA